MSNSFSFFTLPMFPFCECKSGAVKNFTTYMDGRTQNIFFCERGMRSREHALRETKGLNGIGWTRGLDQRKQGNYREIQKPLTTSTQQLWSLWASQKQILVGMPMTNKKSKIPIVVAILYPRRDPFLEKGSEIMAKRSMDRASLRFVPGSNECNARRFNSIECNWMQG